jgi:hypothetical protein
MDELWEALVSKVRRSDGTDLVGAALCLFIFVLGPLLAGCGVFIYQVLKLLMVCP